MAHKFKTPEFQKLKDKWYEKLKDKGFKDLEKDEDSLKVWECSFIYRYDVGQFSSTRRYYELAGQFLHSHKFASKKDKKIWELHSQGKKERDIAVALKIRYGGNMFATISRLRKIMLAEYEHDE